MICIEIYSWLFHVLFSCLKYLVLKFTLYLWTFCFVDYNYLYWNLPLIYERFVSVGYNNLYYPLKFTFLLSSFFLVGYYSFSWNLLLTYLCFVYLVIMICIEIYLGLIIIFFSCLYSFTLKFTLDLSLFCLVGYNDL